MSIAWFDYRFNTGDVRFLSHVRVIRHGSSSIRFSMYQAMLKRASRLVPPGVSVCFLADRGFADTQLMRYLRSGVALAMSGFGLKATVSNRERQMQNTQKRRKAGRKALGCTDHHKIAP